MVALSVVYDVDPKALLPLKLLGDRPQHRRIDLGDRPAAAADQVNVLVLAGGVIGRRAV